jgi:hypothetical protein
MTFVWLLELISSAAGSGSAFGMRIQIQEKNRMRILNTALNMENTITFITFTVQGSVPGRIQN